MKKIMILAIGIAISFAACKKSGVQSTPPIKITNTGCMVTNHLVDRGPFDGRTYYYYYDKNNQMTNYAHYNNTQPGYPILRDTIFYSSPGAVSNVSLEVGGARSSQYFPSTTLYQYGNVTGLLPASEKTFGTPEQDYKPGDIINSPIAYYGYSLDFDKQNRLYYVERLTLNGSGRVKMDIFYNDKNNVIKMVIENITGVRGTTTITVSAYDDKPNPYVNMPYWKLALAPDWVDPYDVESLLTALSQNNPMDFTLNATYIGSATYIYSRTMTYTYNDKGLPMTRSNIQNQTGQVGSNYTFSETYAYSCK
ncbi:hypothetical protein [Mucilaginibacter sp. OK098]|uniref:hypothetical protein n=1 Tax=Mucilaginibacter sp. OK098 TaxID=1855297 RepID=UPI00091BA683|nr:hypothetical protein [Mucilaginibacter sp. OK098]SHN19782.1 hypothetical protein SAMN05216524_106329 [Mucilaginibacter sp. OK098]